MTLILFVLLKQRDCHVSIQKRSLGVFGGDFGGCHGYDADGFVANNHLRGWASSVQNLRKLFSFAKFLERPTVEMRSVRQSEAGKEGPNNFLGRMSVVMCINSYIGWVSSQSTTNTKTNTMAGMAHLASITSRNQ